MGLKISIVTPSLNQGRFLESTIRSVVEHDYEDLEYIIIDGGFTDNSVDIIRKYEKYITYWVSELDSGQSHAINKGFAKCTGDIVAWLNSDDEIFFNTGKQTGRRQWPLMYMLSSWTRRSRKAGASGKPTPE